MKTESLIGTISSRNKPLQRDWLTPLALVVLAVAVIAVIIVRLHAAPVPLERDEGEYALMGQLIMDGIPPYSVAANMKLPGTYYAYSAIMALFGQSATGIHIGLIFVNLFSTLMLYLLARRLLDAVGAALAGASYIIMSLDNSVLGLFAHASQFVVMFVLAAMWLLQESTIVKKRAPLLLGAGLCLGLAVLMKQQSVFFALFGLLWFFYSSISHSPIAWKRLFLESGYLAGGIILPYMMILALMAYQGTLQNFWFWTVNYALSYASEIDIKTGTMLFQLGFFPLIESYPIIWLVALAGLISSWSMESGRKLAFFCLFFFLFSFFSVCPGLYFRPHYFVQLLPATALYAGVALSALKKVSFEHANSSHVLRFVVLVAIVMFSLTGVLSMDRKITASTLDRFSRSIYGDNPFPESIKVAEYIKNNTNPGDCIAVLGSEPQIYFYAHRRPAMEYIYMYGLMELQPFAERMQKNLITQVEKNSPQFLVLVTAGTSWLERRKSSRLIFSWMEKYIRDHYRSVLVADIYSDQTLWLTGKDAESQGRSSSRLIVFKRQTGVVPEN